LKSSPVDSNPVAATSLPGITRRSSIPQAATFAFHHFKFKRVFDLGHHWVQKRTSPTNIAANTTSIRQIFFVSKAMAGGGRVASTARLCGALPPCPASPDSEA
jgi:hypothetical protein